MKVGGAGRAAGHYALPSRPSQDCSRSRLHELVLVPKGQLEQLALQPGQVVLLRARESSSGAGGKGVMSCHHCGKQRSAN